MNHPVTEPDPPPRNTRNMRTLKRVLFRIPVRVFRVVRGESSCVPPHEPPGYGAKPSTAKHAKHANAEKTPVSEFLFACFASFAVKSFCAAFFNTCCRRAFSACATSGGSVRRQRHGGNAFTRCWTGKQQMAPVVRCARVSPRARKTGCIGRLAPRSRSDTMRVAVGFSPRNISCSGSVAERRLKTRSAFNRRSATNAFDRTDPWAQAHGYRQHLAPRDQASQSPDPPPKGFRRISACAIWRDRRTNDERVTDGEGGDVGL